MKKLGLMMAVVLGLMAVAAQAEPVTARKALELANQKLPDAAQNNLIWIEGTLSDTSLRPRQWEITFYDPERLNAGTMVRMQDNSVKKIGGAVRMFDDARWSRFGRNFSGYNLNEIISLARWRFDSDAITAKIGRAHV